MFLAPLAPLRRKIRQEKYLGRGRKLDFEGASSSSVVAPPVFANPNSRSPQSRAWQCVINNFVEKDILWVKSLEAKRCVASLEVGDSGMGDQTP